MSDNNYKSQKNKFTVYIVGIFILGVALTYIGWKNRLLIKNNGVVTGTSFINAEFIGGIVLLAASILFTVMLFWIDKKVKSSSKK